MARSITNILSDMQDAIGTSVSCTSEYQRKYALVIEKLYIELAAEIELVKFGLVEPENLAINNPGGLKSYQDMQRAIAVLRQIFGI